MMITIQETTEVTPMSPSQPSKGETRSLSARIGSSRRKPSRGKTWLLGGVALGLALFNAWWYWRDTRPVADRKTIALWMNRQDYALAEPELREQLRRSPNDGEARLTLARLLAARNDLPGCAEELHKVPFWYPKKGEALFREGNVHLLLNRAKDAEAAWLEILKVDPLHPQSPDIYHDAFFELMKLYATEDRWDDAFVMLWRAYDEAGPDDRPTLLMWRVRAELERVSPSESLPRLQKYVDADPQDFEALRALARAEQALGKMEAAEKHFQACLKATPANARLWRDYMTFLHEQGDRKACYAAVSKAPKEADVEPDVWKFRAMAREDAGDFNGAAECYEQAIERNPNIVEYHYRLAIVEERLGRREKAVEQRKAANTLREARAELPNAYTDFLDARDNQNRGGPTLAESVRKLTTIFHQLGLVRGAEAWKELGATLAPR